MRRVNLRTGLKQRINEIIGTDYLTEGDVPGVTIWSIQAAMLSNLRRIVSAFGASGYGRPVEGLWVTQSAPTSITIGQGKGFTQNGDVIVIPNNISSIVGDTSDGDRYVYLQHKMGTVEGDTNPAGKKTGFVGKPGSEDIVYDDLASTEVGALSQDIVDQIVVINSSAPPLDNDHIYLATVTMSGGVIDSINNTGKRGLSPSDPSGNFLVDRLLVREDTTFADVVTFTEKIIVSEIEGTGTVNIVGDFVVKDSLTVDNGATLELITGSDLVADGQTGIDAGVIVSAPGGDKTLYFKKGILYQVDI